MQRSPIQEDEAFPVTPPTGSTTPGTALAKPPKKFHNGWNRQLENLVAEWADKASCYQWMHQKTENRYQRFNYYFTIPVIVMSTLTGTANFAIGSVANTDEEKKLITFGVGAISLIAGIITTVANFLRYAQGSEAHRVAAISWGKFQRFISIELSLHPNERMDAMSFLKMGRIELDRLIEQSPPIPMKTIEEFYVVFNDKKDIKRPEIAGGIEHTRIFEDRDSRLAKLAAEAAYTIQQKKGLMRQLVLEDIDKRIVSRTQYERLALEEDLRREILSTAKETAEFVARETALTTMHSKGVLTRPSPVAPFSSQTKDPRDSNKDPKDIIPAGVVQKVAQTIKRRISIIGEPKNRAMTIAEAAAAVGAVRQAPPLTIIPTPPSSIKIKIREQPDSDSAEANSIESQMTGIYGEKE